MDRCFQSSLSPRGKHTLMVWDLRSKQRLIYEQYYANLHLKRMRKRDFIKVPSKDLTLQSKIAILDKIKNYPGHTS